MMYMLILGPAFSVLAVPAAAMVWIATLDVLHTACAMYSLVFICSFDRLFDHRPLVAGTASKMDNFAEIPPTLVDQ